MSEVAYRYKDKLYSDGVDQFGESYSTSHVRIVLYTYSIISKTKKGIWIKYCNAKNKKFILLTANKKYACLTKKEALESFKARKRRQRKILESKLNNVNKALYLLDFGVIND